MVSALLITACSGTIESPVAEPGQPTEPSVSTSPTTTSAPTETSVSTPPTSTPTAMVDWLDPGTQITFEDAGFVVSACPGDAVQLCVENDGRTIGAVEATTYPIASFGGLDPAAAPADNLSVFAETFLTSFETDRAEGCGVDYGFDPVPAEPFELGGSPGIAFGFEGTMPDGSASELNLQYATVVEDQFVSITAIAYDDEGCPGRDSLSGFRSAELDAFRPYLEELLRASQLPPVTG